ncbi:hypothetical protein CPC08DRAFT_131706 [Agrocybe pediades]|nr:hypothetical protein CPC08DRAFT_131706 [Agrocybe pediades]
MTPQPQAQQPLRRNLFPSNNNETSGNEAAAPAAAPGPGRYSLGGGEARRVIVQQPWRVKDLVVPPLPGSSRPPVPPMGSRDPPATPGGGFDDLPPPVPASSRKVTEEERKAIQERRRSAVREVREDSFWKDGAPGMSPSKARPSPVKAATGLGVGRPSSRPSVIGTGTPVRPHFASPTKGRTLDFSIAEDDKEESPFLDRDLSKGKAKAETPKASSAPVDDDDDSLDTHGLLERMRETVEDMKRRRSIVTPARLPATPVESEHSIFKLTTGATPAKPSATPMEGEHSIFKLTGSTPRQSVKKLDFSHLAPSSSSKRKVDASASVFTPSHDVDMITSSSEAVPQNEENAEDKMEVEPEVEPEPFSLLAKTPVARASQATVSDAAEKEAPLVPAVVVDAVEDQTEVPQEPEVEEEVKAPTRGRSRLLRAPREEPVVATQQEQTDESEEVCLTFLIFWLLEYDKTLY